MKMKRLAMFLLAAVLTIGASFSSLAAEKWMQDSNGWWFQREDGSYPVSQWEYINGKWYYFWEDGYMAQDCWVGQDDYVGPDGAWIEGYTVDELSVSDAVNVLYRSYDNDSILMEIGQYSDDGTVYASFAKENADNLWFGELTNVRYFNEDGMELTFGEYRNPAQTVLVTWSSKEALDYPTVAKGRNCSTVNSKIFGSYGYEMMLQGN